MQACRHAACTRLDTRAHLGQHFGRGCRSKRGSCRGLAICFNVLISICRRLSCRRGKLDVFRRQKYHCIVENLASVFVVQVQNCRCFVGVSCTCEDIVAQSRSDLRTPTLCQLLFIGQTDHDSRLTFNFWSSGSGASIAV